MFGIVVSRVYRRAAFGGRAKGILRRVMCALDMADRSARFSNGATFTYGIFELGDLCYR